MFPRLHLAGVFIDKIVVNVIGNENADQKWQLRNAGNLIESFIIDEVNLNACVFDHNGTIDSTLIASLLKVLSPIKQLELVGMIDCAIIQNGDHRSFWDTNKQNDISPEVIPLWEFCTTNIELDESLFDKGRKVWIPTPIAKTIYQSLSDNTDEFSQQYRFNLVTNIGKETLRDAAKRINQNSKVSRETDGTRIFESTDPELSYKVVTDNSVDISKHYVKIPHEHDSNDFLSRLLSTDMQSSLFTDDEDEIMVFDASACWRAARFSTRTQFDYYTLQMLHILGGRS